MTEDDIKTFERALQLVARAIAGLDGKVSPVKVLPKAMRIEVEGVEDALGYPLPAAFRDVVTTFSREMAFSWQLELDLPAPFTEIFGGTCEWSLDAIPQLNRDKDGWVADVFPNADDPYDAVWHDTFAFMSVPNGDYLAIDLAPEAKGAVIYLSHDDGAGHGRRIAPDFSSFIMNWSRVGFAGPEDWQWLAFTDEPDGPLNPDGEAAKEFRKRIGLQDPAHAADDGGGDGKDGGVPVIRHIEDHANADEAPAVQTRAGWKKLIGKWFGW